MEERKVRTSETLLKYSNFPAAEVELPVTKQASNEAAEESGSLSWEAPMWGSSTLFAAIIRQFHETSYANEVFCDSNDDKEIKNSQVEGDLK